MSATHFNQQMKDIFKMAAPNHLEQKFNQRLSTNNLQQLAHNEVVFSQQKTEKLKLSNNENYQKSKENFTKTSSTFISDFSHNQKASTTKPQITMSSVSYTENQMTIDSQKLNSKSKKMNSNDLLAIINDSENNPLSPSDNNIESLLSDQQKVNNSTGKKPFFQKTPSHFQVRTETSERDFQNLQRTQNFFSLNSPPHNQRTLKRTIVSDQKISNNNNTVNRSDYNSAQLERRNSQYNENQNQQKNFDRLIMSSAMNFYIKKGSNSAATKLQQLQFLKRQRMKKSLNSSGDSNSENNTKKKSRNYFQEDYIQTREDDFINSFGGRQIQTQNSPQKRSVFFQPQALDQQHLQDAGDVHNIYGHFNNFIEKTQGQMQQSLNHWNFTFDLLNFIDQQSQQHLNQSSHPSSKQVQTSIELQKGLLQNSQIILQNILPLLVYGLEKISQRDLLQKCLVAISQEGAKTKINMLFVMMTYSQAQIAMYYRNFKRAIELFKQAQHSSDNQLIIRYQMQCYQHMGVCFQTLKLYQLALLYLFKYLQLAWFLSDKDAEINAYDRIGVQYYYLGDLQHADYFHKKMLKGQCEAEDSEIRQLGIKKVTNHLNNAMGINEKLANAVKQSQNLRNQMKNESKDGNSIQTSDKFKGDDGGQGDEVVEIGEYFVSSSDEEYQLPITLKQDQKELNLMQTNIFFKEARQRNRLRFDTKTLDSLTHKAAKQALFGQPQQKLGNSGYMSNLIKTMSDGTEMKRQILNLANENIGAQFRQQNKPYFQQEKGLKFTPQSFQPIKDSTKNFLRINHLSVNRLIDNYGVLDLRMMKIPGYSFSDMIYDQQEKEVQAQITKIFLQLADNVVYSIANIEMLMRRIDFYQYREINTIISNMNSNSGYGNNSSSNNNINNNSIQTSNNFNQSNKQQKRQRKFAFRFSNGFKLNMDTTLSSNHPMNSNHNPGNTQFPNHLPVSIQSVPTVQSVSHQDQQRYF